MEDRQSNRRSFAMEKSVVTFLIFFGIITVCNGASINVDAITENGTNQNSEMCQTSECVMSAASILEKMDSKINPCDDFYAFTCGNFANQAIPDGDESATFLHDRLSDVQSILRKALTTDNNNDFKMLNKLKNFYNLCMNEDLIEEQGKTPLLKILKKLGGWPIILGDEWKTESFNWLDFMVKRRKLGLYPEIFMSLDITVDLNNSSKYIIDIGHDVKSQSFLRKFAPKSVKRYAIAFMKYMTNVAVILGANRTQATKEAAQVMIFSIGLKMIQRKMEKRVEDTVVDNAMTIRELSKEFPIIQWKKFLNRYFDSKVTFVDEDIVNVSDDEYIHELLKLIYSTPKRVLANYAVWQDIMNIAQYLTRDIREEKLSFEREIDPNIVERKWKRCIKDISEDFPIAIGSLFVRKYLQTDTKKNVVEIVSNIRDSFYNMLKEADWMDDLTKQNALEKAAAMTSMVAYPEELFNDTLIEKYYANLEINTRSYLEAHLRVNIFDDQKLVKSFRKPINKEDWTTEAGSELNAVYNPQFNRIILSAAFLNGVTYHRARPKYLNYGAIGFIIGHEITHGFDNIGQDFDIDGNMQDWWEPNTNSKFVEKMQCITDQYSKYNVTEIGENVDGILTLNENVADNGGIKAAYLAYSEWLNHNGNEPKLPGLNYTNHQMFWISSASLWCSNYRLTYLKAQMKDVHAPAEFRVIGSLSNRPEFARDFDCPLGSKMNPIHKCSVW